jgi:tRNA-2-methylthio-N6-dimethylallyladenosine synthase
MFSFKYSRTAEHAGRSGCRHGAPKGADDPIPETPEALQREIQAGLNERMVGCTVDVLVDAASRRRETELSGRTSTNVVVNLPGEARSIGQIVRVHIERAGPHSVWGQVAEES